MPEILKLESLLNDQPQEILQISSGVITLGRDVDNSIVVDSSAVSRRHGCIVESGSQWIYTDLGSTNGSWVNGVAAQGGRIRLLRPGDVIQVANFPFRLSRIQDYSLSLQKPTPSILVFLDGSFQYEKFLNELDPAFVVGGDGSHIPTASQVNAEQLIIERQEHYIQLTIQEHGEQVLVNGVLARGLMTLADRDVIEIAGYTLILSDLGSASPEVDWRSRIEPGAREAQAGVTAYGQEQSDHSHTQRPHHSVGDWDNEAYRRRANSGQRFVFGSNIGHADDEPVEGTIAMSSHQTGAMPQVGGLRFASAKLQKRQPSMAPLLIRTLFVLAVLLFLVGLVILAML